MFGDESADETKSRVFAVACVVGSEDEWALAVREWLRRTRGKQFHANKCESEFAHDPDRQKHKDNLKLYEDLTKILAAVTLSALRSRWICEASANACRICCLTSAITSV
jgi:hypothetical protein